MKCREIAGLALVHKYCSNTNMVIRYSHITPSLYFKTNKFEIGQQLFNLNSVWETKAQ
jgi:hypothetical protein